MKLHHIGFISHEISKDILIYEKLGYQLLNEPIIDTVQNNKILFLTNGVLPYIELIEPNGKKSSVCNFSHGYHHIAYDIDDQSDIKELFNSLKIGKIFTGPITAPALENRKVYFAYLRNHELIELII